MEYFEKKRVVITGASSGIGAALARHLAGKGADLFLIARRKDRLERLAGETPGGRASMHLFVGDVTAREGASGSMKRIAASIRAKYGPAQIVVANAGFGVSGFFDQLTLADYRRQFETNVFGVLQTAKAFLPHLKETRGTLVLIASVAGHVSPPGVSPYGMSKFAVRALGDSLRAELRPHRVRVVLVSPGFIDTEIHRVDNLGKLHETSIDGVPRWIMMKSEKAARVIARGIRRGSAEVVVTWHGKAIVLLARLLPGLIRWSGRFMAKAPTQGKSS